MHPMSLGGAFAAVALLAGAASAAPANANDPQQALLTCFNEGLKQHVMKRQSLPAMPEANEFTQLFLASQYALQLRQHLQTAGASKPFVFKCDESLANTYVQAYVKAQLERTSAPAESLGQSGTQPLEADDVFIRHGQSILGSHVKGHSDITEALLKELTGDDAFDRDAADLLVWSSQAGDLYFWTDPTFHAQAKDCPEKQPADQCVASVRTAAATFPEFLTRRLDVVVKAAKSHDKAAAGKAVFELGLLLHVVQDLAFHKGMTLSQHAGLSYYRGQNPDEPEATRFNALLDLARSYSKQAITLLKPRLTADEWKRLRTVKAPNGSYKKDRRDKQAIAEAALADESAGKKRKQDLTLASLLEYVTLATGYPLGLRDEKELDEAARGLWSPDEVMSVFAGPVPRP